MASINKEFTEDEIIATLKHSNDPVILVEGKTDLSIYRQIEKQLNIDGAIIPCGGRKNLFSIFKRREEYPNCTICYVADRDMYYFDGVPDEYRPIVFTTGYSIENDVLAGSNIFNLYDLRDDCKKAASEAYDQIREQSSIWWAFQVQEHRCDRNPQCKAGIREIIQKIPTNNKLSPEVFTRYGQTFKEPPAELFSLIYENFELAIRGHQLEEIHQALLKDFRIGQIRKGSLCFQLAALNPSDYFIQICNSVETKLQLEPMTN